MNDEALLEALPVEAHSVATLDRPRAQAIELLDGDEIIQLCIKPSHWFILMVSARAVIAATLVGLAAWSVRSAVGAPADALLLLAVVGGLARVAIASLQWASSLYVLTNRRVVRFRGVMAVERQERMLAELGEPCVVSTPPQRWLRLGSIMLPSVCDRREVLGWEHLSNVEEVHERLRCAIGRSRR